MFDNAALKAWREFTRLAHLPTMQANHPMGIDALPQQNGSAEDPNKVNQAKAAGQGGVTQHQQAREDLGGTPNPDQTSSGEQQFRELLTQLGLSPEVIDAACQAVAGGAGDQDPMGASMGPIGGDEPPEFTARPNVGAGPNKPAQGGFRSTGTKTPAGDSALYGAHIGDASTGFHGSSGSARLVDRASQLVKLDVGLRARIGQDGKRQAVMKIARDDVAKKAVAEGISEAHFEHECPFAGKVGFV